MDFIILTITGTAVTVFVILFADAVILAAVYLYERIAGKDSGKKGDDKEKQRKISRLSMRRVIDNHINTQIMRLYLYIVMKMKLLRYFLKRRLII